MSAIPPIADMDQSAPNVGISTEGGGRSLRIDSRNQPGTARERLIDFDADRLDDGAPFDDF